MLKLMLQLAVILLACKAIGWFGQKYLGQTQVVMEMVAGVMLGPSLLGQISPQTQLWLFPKEWIVVGQTVNHPSMSILYCLSQLGLVMYMFLIGLEFDANMLRQSAKGALAISLAGIAAPFVLGALLGLSFAGNTTFFGPGVNTWNGALYMGAAMCITAFPMLARILFEQGIAQTRLGVLALASGASNDVVAWIMLAVVIAVNKGDSRYASFAIGGGAVFALVILTGGKYILKGLESIVQREKRLTSGVFLTTLICLMMCSWFTDFIGVYAVFGAFILGIAMPRGEYATLIRQQLEMPVTGLLLPLFFVFSGLNTRLALVNTPYLWMMAGLVCLAAMVGKGGACGIAARLSGEKWRESAAIGCLMNARGLMELILVNIALAAKVITPTLFTILVLMAIITTLMASPLYKWLYGSVKIAPGSETAPVPA